MHVLCLHYRPRVHIDFHVCLLLCENENASLLPGSCFLGLSERDGTHTHSGFFFQQEKLLEQRVHRGRETTPKCQPDCSERARDKEAPSVLSQCDEDHSGTYGSHT